MTTHEPGWSVELEFTVGDECIYARARLLVGGHEMIGRGAARSNPSAQPVPGLGVHAAAAAALHDLAHHVESMHSAYVR